MVMWSRPRSKASGRCGTDDLRDDDAADRPSVGDPRGRRELGAVARRRRLGALRDRLARRRLDDGDLVSGTGAQVHRGEPRGLRARRQHPALSRRVHLRHRRHSRDRADEDDDQSARRWSTASRSTWCAPAASTTSSRSAHGPLGHRAPPADLREGPDGPGRAVAAADARCHACSRSSPRAIATSAICRSKNRVHRERPTCRACEDRPSRRSTRKGERGWRARRRPAIPRRRGAV